MTWRQLSRGFVSITVLATLLVMFHLGAYVALRWLGVYEIFYNQGYGDVRGSTGLHWLDLSYFPYMLWEGELHVQLDRWGLMPHPSGG